MNKCIKVVFCVPYAMFKCLILKIKNGRRFNSPFLAMMSPLTEITVDKKSMLYIKSNFRMHNGSKIRVRHGAKVFIGKNFSMSNGCVVTSYDCIEIGDNVMLGPNVLIYDQDHDYRAFGGIAAMKYLSSPIKIGSNVWIGANTLILRGTTIGDNCVIGGGSVIKGDFPSDTVIIQKRDTILLKQKKR